MTSVVAKTVAKNYLAKNVEGFEPPDPYYETYTDNKGKEQKRPRPVPEILSKKEAKLLKKIRKRARRLDNGFSICGFRFGYTFIIALIPVAGDVAQFSLSHMLVVNGSKGMDLPSSLRSHMIFNNIVGLAVGLIPLVGDIGLAAWKPNTRNVRLVEEFLVKRAARAATGAGNGNDSDNSEQIAANAIKKQRESKHFFTTGARVDDAPVAGTSTSHQQQQSTVVSQSNELNPKTTKGKNVRGQGAKVEMKPKIP